MKLLFLFTSIQMTIFLSGCSLVNAQTGLELEGYSGLDRTTNEINAFIDTKMGEYNIPGLSFAMITDAEVVHHLVRGYADLENELSVTPETIFEGASISKSVFAYFVMTYVEEGRLNLDRPLYEYLPEPDIAYDERYKTITARMVLSHRSGMPNWRFNEEDGRLKLYFEPGTDYLYSGEGYQYLARVLMDIEGTDDRGLETIFQKRVAKPLELEHTVFMQNAYSREHKAEAYNEDNQMLMLEDTDEFGSAYSIHTEPLDFAQWMIAVMNRELLSPESYEELFTRHSIVPSNSEFDLFYTLGFYTLDLPDTNIYLHTGNNEGFTCFFLMDLEKDWGFVLLTNSEFGEELGNDMAEFFLTEAEGQ